MSKLIVDALSVRYPGETKPAVENVSFSLEKGTVTVLLGPNGSGKSRLLKAILNLVDHTGTVQFFGKSFMQATGTIGYVPQRYAVDKTVPTTVHELVSLSLVMCKHSAKEKKQMITEALQKVDLREKEQEKVADLSGGQLQRVLLARALVHRPSVLLLDEPEAGVDVGGEQRFYSVLKKLAQDEGVTVIIASHEVALVKSFADQVICINKQLICSGPPRKVLHEDTFKKLYGEEVMFYGHTGHSHSFDAQGKRE